MSRLGYWFSEIRKIKKIYVTYSLITKSGYDILTLNKEITPKKLLMTEYYGFGYNCWNKVIEKNYKNKFIKDTKELLLKYQKKKLNKVGNGYLESGDYIVKGVYDVEIVSEKISFEEYKKYRGIEN